VSPSITCPHCGQQHPVGARFCPITGKTLPAAVRRGGRPILPFALAGILGLFLLSAGLWLVLVGQLPVGRLQPEPATPVPVAAVSTRSPAPQATDTARPQATLTSRPSEPPFLSATPFPSQTSLPTATEADRLVCPDAPLTRLRVGDRAYVSLEPPDPNRVRDQPSTSARVLGQIVPGEEVMILDGPACANSWVWWQVRSESQTTLIGWTAEGDRQNYWLVPLTSGSTPVIAALPRVYDFFICQQLCLENGSNATGSVPGGTTILHAHWNYENMPIGSHYVRAWTMDGQEWVRYDCTWPGPTTGADDITLREPGGLRSGIWEVTISVDGVVLLRDGVVVEGSWSYWSPAGVFNTCYDES